MSNTVTMNNIQSDSTSNLSSIILLPHSALYPGQRASFTRVWVFTIWSPYFNCFQGLQPVSRLINISPHYSFLLLIIIISLSVTFAIPRHTLYGICGASLTLSLRAFCDTNYIIWYELYYMIWKKNINTTISNYNIIISRNCFIFVFLSKNLQNFKSLKDLNHKYYIL